MATTNSKSIRLALKSGTPYNFTINWGDGIEESYNFTTSTGIQEAGRGIMHTYATGGRYKISIRENVEGGFPGLNFTNTNTTLLSYDAIKLKNIDKWGTNKFGGTSNSINSMFFLAKNLTLTATDVTGVFNNITDFGNAWNNCTSLSSFPLIDTSNATNFAGAWAGCTKLKTFPLLNTSKVIYFNSTWHGCNALTAFSLLDFRSGNSFGYTWNGCSSLKTFPPIVLSASNINFDRTWGDCTSLTAFPYFDTSNVVQMYAAWQACRSLSSFPALDTSNVITNRLDYAWHDCSELRNFPLINPAKVTVMEATWLNCGKLTTFPPITTGPNCTNLTNTWANCTSLTAFPENARFPGVKTFYQTWYNCNSLKSFPSTLITLTANSLDIAWAYCTSLTSFPNISCDNVTNFRYAWAGDGPYWPHRNMQLSSFPIINTLSGQDFEGTWRGLQVTSFPSLSFDNALNLDSTWIGCDKLRTFPLINVQKVTHAPGTWYRCSALTAFPALSFSACTNFTRTWSWCTGLSSFPEIITPNATTFECAFGRGRYREWGHWFSLQHPMTAIPSFFLKSSNTSKATNFRSTWNNCGRLLSFPDSIDMRNATNVAGAWADCISLTAFPNIMLSAVQYFGIGHSIPGAPAAGLPNIESFNQDGDYSSGFLWSDAWLGGEGAWMHCRFTTFPEICTQNGIDFSHAWYCCKSLSAFPLLNTSKGKYFVNTWRGCSAIKTLPLMNFTSANDVRGAFSFMYSLTSFPLIDLSNCVYFGGAWNNCRNLVTFPAINTVSATSLQHINYGDNSEKGGAWENCYSLTAFPMIDTSNVNNFKYAWRNCYNLSASPFPTLNMSKMSKSYIPGFFEASYERTGGTGGDGCFEGVKLQTQSYSALLTSLCATNFNTEVTFHGGNSTYNTPGSAARAFLTKPIAQGGRAWTITDGGYQAGT